MRKQLTYADYPFDDVPAWQMKLEYDFSRVCGGLALDYMIGKLTEKEFVEAVIELRAEQAEEFLDIWCEGLSK